MHALLMPAGFPRTPLGTLLVAARVGRAPLNTLLVPGSALEAHLGPLLVAGVVRRTFLQPESYSCRLQQHLFCEADIVHMVQRQASACSKGKGPRPLVADCLHQHCDRC